MNSQKCKNKFHECMNQKKNEWKQRTDASPCMGRHDWEAIYYRFTQTGNLEEQ